MAEQEEESGLAAGTLISDGTASLPEYLHVTGGEDCQVVNTFTAGEGEFITSFVETPEVAESIGPTSTIIYVQPDGSFVEGTGLTAEEQQQLVEQLAKQQLVEVTESEAAQFFESHQPQHFIQHGGALSSEELQPRSLVSLGPQEADGGRIVLSELQRVALEPSPALPVTPQPLTIVHNASQQLQNVAMQVALQQNQVLNGTRLIPKKLETIRIQLQNLQTPETKEKSAPLNLPVQQKTVLLGQPVAKVGMTGGLKFNTSPQIIRIQPVLGDGQQQFVLHSPNEPPIQLLVQKQLSTVGAIHMTQKATVKNAVNGRAPRATVTFCPAVHRTVTSGSDRKEGEKEKPKKPQKIKTRSGRISRPPKYKVKDYKFIRREDLADGHQSDSDDYSELSVGEEDGDETKNVFVSVDFNLNPKMFKCETCDKAYIGKGGLSRHYMLNPAHKNKNDVESDTYLQEPGLGILANHIAETTGLSPGSQGSNSIEKPEREALPATETLNLSTPSVPLQDAQSVSPPAEAALNQVVLSFPGPGRPRGPGRPKGPGRPAHSKVAGRSGRQGRRAKPGRPPKYLGGVSTEQQIQRRKARLKEIIQQCGDEELMELVLPRLARVMTVWEFLIMKVEKGCPSQAHFADVYRELEQLHTQVKKMAEEHFGSASSSNVLEHLEIRNPQVSKSLGIEDLLKSKVQFSVPVQCCTLGVPQKKQQPSDTNKQKERENDIQLPSAKKIRIEDMNGTCLKLNGLEVSDKDVPATVAPVEQDLRKTQKETLALLQANGKTNGSTMDVNHLNRELLQTSNEIDNFDSRSNQPDTNILLCRPTEVPMPVAQTVLVDMQPDLSRADNREEVSEEFPAVQAKFSTEALVQEHLISQSLANESVAEEVPTHMPIANSIINSDFSKGNALVNCCNSEDLNDSDIVDQMQQLEKALSRDGMPLNHSYRNVHLVSQQPVETLATPICLENEINEEAISGLHIANLGELHGQSTEQNGCVEQAVTVDGTVEFQLADDNQELLTQGNEQIFIQTSDGIIMHHSTGGIASEGIVIVTNADGTTMHIRTPDGVPLETVEALLAMEAEGHGEGILVTETHQ
uniref:C2H2-type domain-containing protein n=1 Tax=Erpetoichthys calabaricus TaxID=27687 RepID=A0A8C4TDU0_ERPCA